MAVEAILKELELDDNQIKVYLACLKLGSSKVHEISQKSSLIRTTTYGILKSLIEKGLISTIKKGNITHYQASSPKQLIEILDEKKRKIQSILPDLEKMQKFVPTKHNVELFEGKEGLKAIVNDIISKPNETYYVIGFFKKWVESMGMFSEIVYRKKKERNIKSKVIVDESERSMIKDERISNSQARFVKGLQSDSEVLIYHDKIAFVSFEEDSLKGVIIQDKAMADLQRYIFEQLWKQASK